MREQVALGFQVRVLRVNGTGRLPDFLAKFEPCQVFLGSLFQFKSIGSSIEINLGSLKSLSWLALERGRAPENGRYLIVAEPLGRDASLIRVQRGAA